MTTKLNLIKSALRESIDIAERARLNRVDVGPFFTEQQKADAAFDMDAQKMTPLACKALLTAIEGLEQTLIGIGNTDDRMSDENSFIVNSIGDLVEKALSSITSEWPNV